MPPKLLLVGLTAGPLCFLGLCPAVLAQSPRDTPGNEASGSYAAEAPTAVLQLYHVAAPVSSQLYNGPEYVNYALRYVERKGHQFFLTPETLPGSVTYNQHQFNNLPLRYDTVLDQVVIGQPTSPLLIRLVSEKLPRFTIDGHPFMRIVADSTTGSALSTGYYEVLHEGRVRVLARRSKRMQERIAGRIVTAEFIPTEKLYARKDGQYRQLNSKSAVLALFADRQAEVQAYMRENNLKLRKAQFENVVVLLANFYDQLPPR